MRRTTVTVCASMILALMCDAAGPGPKVYSTWGKSMEVDKCASAWLIKRFVDKEAEFRFYPQGALDMEGVQFDVPTAELRSGRNRSTFESVVDHYGISDPAVVAISKVIREIEMSVWQDKRSDLAGSLPKLVEGVRLQAKDDREALQKGFVIMDALYAYTRKQVGE